jgi:hypothetical protein
MGYRTRSRRGGRRTRRGGFTMPTLAGVTAALTGQTDKAQKEARQLMTTHGAAIKSGIDAGHSVAKKVIAAAPIAPATKAVIHAKIAGHVGTLKDKAEAVAAAPAAPAGGRGSKRRGSKRKSRRGGRKSHRKGRKSHRKGRKSHRKGRKSRQRGGTTGCCQSLSPSSLLARVEGSGNFGPPHGHALAGGWLGNKGGPISGGRRKSRRRGTKKGMRRKTARRAYKHKRRH